MQLIIRYRKIKLKIYVLTKPTKIRNMERMLKRNFQKSKNSSQLKPSITSRGEHKSNTYSISWKKWCNNAKDLLSSLKFLRFLPTRNESLYTSV